MIKTSAISSEITITEDLFTRIQLTDSHATATYRTYKTIDMAYDFFNAVLFNGMLPPVAITLSRKKGSKGYFHSNKFGNRLNEFRHEIALNPDLFLSRDDIGVLGTLVHEMCHVYQHDFGKYPRNGYHDKQFTQIMQERGLVTSDTGEPGGKHTGQRITHYIEQGGRFDLAVKEWVKRFDGITEWGSLKKSEGNKKSSESNTKFTCPECSQNAWAKPTARLLCANCTEDNERLIEMIIAE